jgi:hypothetical protein
MGNPGSVTGGGGRVVPESTALSNWILRDLEVTVTDRRDDEGFVFRLVDEGEGPFCEIEPLEKTLRLDTEELGIFQQVLKRLQALNGKSLGEESK